MDDCPGSGSTFAGRWQVGALLGRGAMAAVYEGLDLEDGSSCAIKVLRATGEADALRFTREVAVLQALEHPAIVQLLDNGVADGCPFLVLERVDGGSLDQLIASAPLAPARVATLGAELADGLAAAHSQGIVHRDIKPSNVLVRSDGHALLADFGVAQVAGAEALTNTGWAIGTPAYLAPEQARGEGASAPTDVFSLGLVLLECVTGVRAYPGAGLDALMARLDRPPAIPSSLPPRMRAVLAAMTACATSDRPSARDTAELLRIAAIPAEAAADETSLVAVASEATAALPALPVPVVVADPAPLAAVPARGGRAVAALAVALLLILAGAWSVAGAGGGPAAPAAQSSTTATIPATTAPAPTAPPTTAPPPTAPAPPAPGGGHGHGHGHGHGG